MKGCVFLESEKARAQGEHSHELLPEGVLSETRITLHSALQSNMCRRIPWLWRRRRWL